MNNLRLLRSNAFPLIRKQNFIAIKIRLLPNCYIHLSSVSSLRASNFSSQSVELNESEPPKPKYKKPVDWLPFEWRRRPMFNIFEDSGDTIKENTIDPSLPKPDFELSDELKTADPFVRQYFSLQTASKGEVKEVCKRHILKRIQRHPNDYDSLEVKIALMTIQVRSLFQHKADAPKQEVTIGRISLPIIIQKRNKLLKQLREIDYERFCWLLDELKLYYKPKPLGVVNPPKYCKKWDLRRLTKEYCAKIVADKKAAYHEELKKQQAEFLEEKKKILAWIEEEEKAIKLLNI